MSAFVGVGDVVNRRGAPGSHRRHSLRALLSHLHRKGIDVATVAPRLGELLSLRPGTRFPVSDSKITTRCHVEECLTLQRLVDAPVTRGPDETCYQCDGCGAALVVVRRAGATPRPSLRLAEELGEWSYWLAGSGVHVGLANVSRVRATAS